MKCRRFALALAASLTLCAQQEATDDRRSLQATMRVLEQNLPQTVNYVVTTRNRADGSYAPPISRAYELSNVTTGPDGCTLRFHKSHGALNQDLEIPLQFVNDKGIKLRTMDQTAQERNIREGHPELATTTQPTVFMVTVSSPNVTTTFFFTDKAMADRVSQALRQASALCPDYTNGWR